MTVRVKLIVAIVREVIHYKPLTSVPDFFPLMRSATFVMQVNKSSPLGKCYHATVCTVLLSFMQRMYLFRHKDAYK